MIRCSVLLSLAIASTLLGGCGATSTSSVEVNYASGPRANYDRGLAELADDDHAEAIKYFTFVKDKWAFSAYATLAELRIADTYFAQEKYIEAVDAYRNFAKFHPTHAEVMNGYVAYRIAEAFVKQIPSDWFLVPPAYEKDQGATQDALRELRTFMQNYAHSKHLPKVKDLYRNCMRRLAEHELYVARFYLERDKPRAAILRLETLLSRYGDAGADPEIMLLLGKTYLKLDQKEKARETFANLIRKYPQNANSAKAKLYLEHITGQRE